jgi:hypothetical protein
LPFNDTDAAVCIEFIKKVNVLLIYLFHLLLSCGLRFLSSKPEAPSYASVYLFARNFVSFHDLEVNPGHLRKKIRGK